MLKHSKTMVAWWDCGVSIIRGLQEESIQTSLSSDIEVPNPTLAKEMKYSLQEFFKAFFPSLSLLTFK